MQNTSEWDLQNPGCASRRGAGRTRTRAGDANNQSGGIRRERGKASVSGGGPLSLVKFVILGRGVSGRGQSPWRKTLGILKVNFHTARLGRHFGSRKSSTGRKREENHHHSNNIDENETAPASDNFKRESFLGFW